MKLKTNKRLSLILTIFSAIIAFPVIFYSAARAQEQSSCFMVDPSGQVRNLDNLCGSANQIQKSKPMGNAKDFFQRASEFARNDQRQEAIANYTRAIQLDPNYVEAYVFRGNSLALAGQPLKGIEDLNKAAAILDSRGESQWAAAARKHAELIRQGIEDGEF
jgi:tetratricopeptide (TPR) repeat protein